MRVTLHYYSRSVNRGCDSARCDFCAAHSFRNSQEHRSLGKIQIARSFIETENRVRAETRRCLIGKSQLGA